MHSPLILHVDDVPADPLWLGAQPCPVIVYGAISIIANADVVVLDLAAARILEQKIQVSPIAALVLVQVLRSVESLPYAQVLDVESMAYSTLQSGPEFASWRRKYEAVEVVSTHSEEPILLSREGALIEAMLNRPATRNAISVEIRDALVELLRVLEADDSVTQLKLSGKGACFSSGGELNEFGSLPDPAVAHWVRTVQSPARLLAKLSSRVTCYVHGACIGSGIELPAFAAHLVAHSKTFFQLPELRLGLIPGAGGTFSITRRIGRHRLAWLVLSGRRINAQTALDWGLVDEVIDWQ